MYVYIYIYYYYSNYIYYYYSDCYLEKDDSMIETRRLKNVVIFIQTILSFVLSRKIIQDVFFETCTPLYYPSKL